MRGKRLFTAETIAQGVNAISQLMAHVQNYVPMAAETLDGHCTGCKAVKPFTVEGSETMKNGALRKFGKCTSEGCGRTISKFVAGVKDAA